MLMYINQRMRRQVGEQQLVEGGGPVNRMRTATR